MKLSKKQKEVIKCLRNGGVLITSSEMTGAIVGLNKTEFRINNGVFWRLVDKKILYQQYTYPQNYILTELGKTIEL